jgi:hypothetical protein
MEKQIQCGGSGQRVSSSGAKVVADEGSSSSAEIVADGQQI